MTFDSDMTVEKCLVMEHFINGKAVDCKRAVGPEGGQQQQQQQQAGALREAARGGSQPARQGAELPARLARQGGCFRGAADGGGVLEPPRRIPHRCCPARPAPCDAGQQGAASQRTGKQPDWVCGDCGNKNYGWRSNCNKCKANKPESMAGMAGMAAMGMGAPAMMGAGGMAGMLHPGMMNGMMGGFIPAAAMAQMMPGGMAGKDALGTAAPWPGLLLGLPARLRPPLPVTCQRGRPPLPPATQACRPWPCRTG